MKTKICIIIILTILIGVCPSQADTVWLSGHHEIVDGDIYGEIRIYNDVTMDIFGGDIDMLETYDTTVTDWFDGQMHTLWTDDDSVVSIYGGTLSRLKSAGNSVVYIYAYDVTYDPTGGGDDNGWIEGKYYSDDTEFAFSLFSQETYSHINIIPVIYAEIEIKPNTLNLSSKGKWLTCHIWLPEDYNVADVNSESVRLQDEVQPDWIWFNEQQQVAMARFSRSEIAEILEPGDVELTVTGFLDDGSYFIGTDTIRVIDKGRLRGGLVNSNSIVVDDVEYYIQTDKAVYNLGENVQMLYRVTNLGDEDVTFSSLPLPEWNFWVEKHGENIWRAVNVWWAVITEFTLSPGESKEFPALSFPYVWNMRDDENNLVNVGKYNVIGGLYAGSGLWDFTRISVGIKIVPEPKGRVKHN